MGYAMCTERYRYVEWVNRETGQVAAAELYDHQNDPGENTNIAMQPDVGTVRRELSEQLWHSFVKPAPLPKPRTNKNTATAPPVREYTLAELYDDTGDPQQ